MTSARRATTARLAVAAAAPIVGVIATLAGALAPSGARADAAGHAAPGDKETVAARVREATAELVATRGRTLEADVKRAASVPQLAAALGDGVDAATLLDLFETEDWWTPFRTRAVALVSGGRMLAVRGDKDLPLPDAGLLGRAQETGVASGVLVGVRPVLVAVVPVAVARRSDPTFLMFASPFDPAEVGPTLGSPIMLSDGHVALASNGAERPESQLRSLVGREASGTFVDPAGGWLAVAVPASPKVWIWVWRELAVDAPAGNTIPLVLSGGAILLGLSAVVLWRRKRIGPAGAFAGVPAGGTTTGPGRAGSAPSPVPEDAERKRRGTLPYDTDDIRRSSAMPQNDVQRSDVHRNDVPRYETPRYEAPAASGAGMPRVAQAVVSTFVPERSRVEPGSNSFGRYRLIDRLGEGGMAEIYTAVLHGAEGFRRVFVLKRLRPEIARNRSAVAQFIDEAKLGSSLVHSNIVPVFDFGKVGDEYFMAQEYIIGRDMIRLLERHAEQVGRPLDEKVVLYMAHEVLDALAYAHNQTDANGNQLGLVHRDIAPGNIMITSRGEVKLTDFGIVKAHGRVSTTDVGVVKGNVSFMSPEQARGQAVDARSDLFSLGLVMYYCLTNDPLYLGEGTFDQLMIAASGPRTEHLRRLAVLPPVAANILERALAISPAARFQTAGEFAAALAPYITSVKAEAAQVMLRLFGEEFRKESSTLF